MHKSVLTICPLCESTNVEIISVTFPLFRHLDFTPFHPGPNSLGRCGRCQLVYRIVDEKDQERIDAIYRSAEYMKHEEPHTVVVDDYKDPVAMSFLQAEIIKPLLPKRNPAVLDIGCFNGRLLLEIGKSYDKADLCGFDVSERPQFPNGPNFRFVSESLERVEGWFDMVLMSHSIQYIRDIHKLFEQIRKRLKPGGILFIQVPNFAKKPCSLLFGDLYYHYTPSILDNIFRRMGFWIDFLANQWFPRDILVIARPNGKPGRNGDAEEDQLTVSLDRVGQIDRELKMLKGDGKVAILGTTIEAAFAHYCLGDRVSYFVDENSSKVGKAFQGKPVLHPQSVVENDMVVIPMGKAGVTLQQRLTNDYRGTYVCI